MSAFSDYISKKLFTYQIQVPGFAQVYIACYKNSEFSNSLDSFNFPEENSKEADPKNLTFSLKSNFAYGGSRLAKCLEDETTAKDMAIRSVNFLALAESHLKHAIINKAIKDGALDRLIDFSTNKLLTSLKAENILQEDVNAGYVLPKGYLDLNIRGSRCIILPENLEIEEILKNPKHPRFYEVADVVFKRIGGFLNGLESANLIDTQGHILDHVRINKGEINLTPDFGRFAEIADILNKFTPQVLCVNSNAGGSNGKAAYTVSGVLAGWQACVENGLSSFSPEETDITFIGSAGALGEIISEYLKNLNFKKVKLCDLQYKLNEIVRINQENDLEKLNIKKYTKTGDKTFTIVTLTDKKIVVNLKDKLIRLRDGGYQALLSDWSVLPAVEGMYTDEALRQSGGVILSTAFGREIENSNLHLIPSGTLFLAAHNIAINLGENGLKIVKELSERNVIFVPGQVLTLGGALTSRLEACFRAEHKIVKANEGKNTIAFPKRLGHEIVRYIVYHITSRIILRNDITPWEALLEYANMSELLVLDDQDKKTLTKQEFIPYDVRY
jgi:hypothetical protein